LVCASVSPHDAEPAERRPQPASQQRGGLSLQASREEASACKLEERANLARTLTNDLGLGRRQINNRGGNRATGACVENESETRKVIVDLCWIKVRSRPMASRR